MSDVGRVVHVLSGEQYDVYVGRSNRAYNLPLSRYANPFKIGPHRPRVRAIADYEFWVRTSAEPAAVWIREHVAELIGKTLACWCSPSPCHGSVLLGLAIEARDAGGVLPRAA